ncbi:MAG TPA: ATP-binding protein [Spirochaetia bacterium]
MGRVEDQHDHVDVGGEEDARRQQSRKLEALGQLTGVITHDFRNILAVITGYCTRAMETVEPGSEARQCMEEIAAATRRATALTERLLDYSRLQRPLPVALDMSDFLGGLRDILDGFVGANIEVILTPSDEPCRALVDPVGMEQVLMNLAANARDAMPDGGTLAISTSRLRSEDEVFDVLTEIPPGDYVALTVSDTGVGMDSATLSHAFEPFFTTKGPGKGTGLGLSSVKEIVRRHKGYVSCRSSPGAGTRFTICLPPVTPCSDG